MCIYIYVSVCVYVFWMGGQPREEGGAATKLRTTTAVKATGAGRRVNMRIHLSRICEDFRIGVTSQTLKQPCKHDREVDFRWTDVQVCSDATFEHMSSRLQAPGRRAGEFARRRRCSREALRPALPSTLLILFKATSFTIWLEVLL